MMCEYCKKKEVDGVIMIGGRTIKVCSPECMDKLLKIEYPKPSSSAGSEVKHG